MAVLVALGTSCHAARRFVTSAQITPVRTGPSKDNNRITRLVSGVPVWAEGKSGQWYKIRFHQGLSGWAHQEDLQAGSSSDAPPAESVTNIAVEPYERGVRLTVYLTGKLPYRIRQAVWPNKLYLDVFGARLAAYGVRFRPIEPFITSLVPTQMMDGWVQIEIGIDARQQAGYDVHYAAADRLVLDIRRPCSAGGLRGKIIALDPGHGGHDLGAVGPTGLAEKDVNLAIGLRLRELLLSSGATVVMTRETDRSLAGRGAALSTELATRVHATKQLWPDVFVSIHNNDLGSGDPNAARGTETYYWTPMSRALADQLQVRICAALGTENRFVSWRDFHVLRETDCPRVLTECMYLSNPAEEAMMRSSQVIQRAAEGILQGLQAYFASAGQ